MLHLTVAGETIRTTGEHPFWSDRSDRSERGGGWAKSSELVPGDRLLTATGEWLTIDAIEEAADDEVVYNCRVAEWHTYFVGDDGWGWALWAHNAYLGLSALAVREQGNGFAALASGWWETLPDGHRLGATVAVTEIAGTKYVTLYANIGHGSRQFTQEQVDRFIHNANEAGWNASHTSGNVHAEMELHMRAPTAHVIGISNPGGPCNTWCRTYFTQHHYYNIVWPGDREATWGNE